MLAVPPTFDPGPYNATVLSGWPVLLNWVIRGQPRPAITWFRNGVSLNYNSGKMVILVSEIVLNSMSESTHLLNCICIFADFEISYDGLYFTAYNDLGGRYSVEATSTEGSLQGAGNIKVTGKFNQTRV